MLTHVSNSFKAIWKSLFQTFQLRQLVPAPVRNRLPLITALIVSILGGAQTSIAQIAALDARQAAQIEQIQQDRQARAERRKARQEETSMAGPPGGFYQSGSQTFNPDHGHLQHHASTAYEGYLRGLANLKYANGAARKLSAEAMILEEQARWAAYENAKKRVETFYARREERERYFSEQKEKALLRDIQGKQILEERRSTEYRAAYRLKLEEFNRSNGQIAWHPVLLAGFFGNHCQKLNGLFKNRAVYSLENEEMMIAEILATLGDLEKCLRDNRDMFTPRDHADAQNFLRGLFYEVAYPPSVG